MTEPLTLILTLEKDKEIIHLINYIQKIGFGELLIKVRKGKPYQIVNIKKSILLTGDDSTHDKFSDEY